MHQLLLGKADIKPGYRHLLVGDQAASLALPRLVPDAVHLPTEGDPLWPDQVPPSHIPHRSRGAACHGERGDSWYDGGQEDCWLG